MSDFVIATFVAEGAKLSGLTPKINIFRIEDSVQVVTNITMPEVTAGLYKYTITGLDILKNYAGFVDGGLTVPTGERIKEFSFSLFLDSRMEDVHDEALGGLEVNITGNELTYTRKSGSTLKKFDLTQPVQPVPGFIKRTPQ